MSLKQFQVSDAPTRQVVLLMMMVPMPLGEQICNTCDPELWL
jgi:hypothetical protein